MSYQFGVHSLVWTGETSTEALTDAAERTTKAGFDVFELNLSAPHEIDAQAVAGVFSSLGVTPTASLALSSDTDVSSTATAVVRRGEELLQSALSTLVTVGGDLLCGVLYSALGKYSQTYADAGRKNAVGVVRTLAQKAAEDGVRVALEVVNRYETNMFNTCDGALRFMDEVGEENVFVHLDTYHMNIEEDGMGAAVLRAGDRLGYVHIGESNRGYLGSGTVDFTSFFRALEWIGYRGTITFESFSSAVVDRSLTGTLAIWRDLWRDSDDLARHARAFISSYAQASASAHA